MRGGRERRKVKGIEGKQWERERDVRESIVGDGGRGELTVV